MKKFEYMTYKMSIGDMLSNHKLNELGEKGWELINTIVPKNVDFLDSCNLIYFILKREIIEYTIQELRR
jgi:hypothetical protein